MAEYIEREAAIKRIQEIYCAGCNSYHGVRCRACGTGDAIDIIEDFPTADVAPVVHARWNIIKRMIENAICSNCGRHFQSYYEAYRYCPNCGAKMDGGDNNEAD